MADSTQKDSTQLQKPIEEKRARQDYTRKPRRGTRADRNPESPNRCHRSQ
ncbi:MAG: hypothetical protein HC880_06805 [Bacteroidia bacterium]|nr:hypothetical protein [Bacteroidia bacterium]